MASALRIGTRGFWGVLAVLAWGLPAIAGPGDAPGYREPPADVVRLLEATRPPEVILHGASGRVALLTREPVAPLARLARPSLGLAGYRFDPETGTSGRSLLVEQVEVLTVRDDGEVTRVSWRPAGGARLAHVAFAPGGRHLAATSTSKGPARLAIFDIETGREQLLDTAINAAFGRPCWWTAPAGLLCRVTPENGPTAQLPRPGPRVVEHSGKPLPTRTYGNLLEDGRDEAMFLHHFTAELARVSLGGSVERIPDSRGLIWRVQPSPGGEFAVVTRLTPPFPHLVRADRFPQHDEIWDLRSGQLARTLRAPASEDGAPMKAVTHRWQPGAPSALGFIEREDDPATGKAVYRFLALDPPFQEAPREVARSGFSIDEFGWTTAGTAYFIDETERGRKAHVFIVGTDGPRLLWSGETEDEYDSPGWALGPDGLHGAALELDGALLLAGDGLGPEGPEPYLDRMNLANLERERIFSSPKDALERVIGMLALDPPALVTSRESENEPPDLFLLQGEKRTRIHDQPNPFPDLADVERRFVRYPRADGTSLQATLYLPASRVAGQALPTLVWIYPYEYSRVDFAEQTEIRRFRFHTVKGPSPLAAPLAGYALLLSPTMPIIGDPGQANDEYLAQLTSSAKAAVDFLVDGGIADPNRIAIGGRSYGAFSAANLLVHTDLFRTAIVMSGAYNRTLTPFGFQHEKRTFWEATGLYAEMSPFFFADRIQEPMLIVHGAADDNPGTPPEQARRMVHALVGNGTPVRYVELPFEGHRYYGRESVLHAAAEMLGWLERTLGPPPRPAGLGPPDAPAQAPTR